jgi:hypothetical protein
METTQEAHLRLVSPLNNDTAHSVLSVYEFMTKTGMTVVLHLQHSQI